MNIFLMLLLWVIFITALILTVYSNLIVDNARTTITLIVAPMTTVVCGYIVFLLMQRYTAKIKLLKYMAYIFYPVALLLGCLFFLIDFHVFSDVMEMSFTAVLGILAMIYTLYIISGHSNSKIQDITIEDWIFRSVWLLFVIGVLTAYLGGKLVNPVEAVAMILFGTLMLYFTLYTVTMILGGGSLSMESHWGGLGGGMGGWRMSRTMVFLLLSLFFGGLTVGVVLNAEYAKSNRSSAETSGPETPTTADEQSTRKTGGTANDLGKG